ncbi:sulfotransferase family protein [Pseudomonas sp. FW306-02-F02-AA]|uniref:Aspartyl beta-hydroxylase n=1 Tax=Pseudomonas fluorescens TaxID=294 RepID=A0A0N9VTB4_PSEFL|nr:MULTISPECIES: aspartyl beta-hydroxylase [Pseudomonas]ALI01634.1 aspartyl beta-hydroxylase [Pseudomonas fluorescens]PMZ07578.1 sulfotransferase family protein [Pseudomonas sp. FW306-02-H06C]PMZ13296.1 sulfotransferase family protein [Pseudomonas sp. FW306-02-F02-AA]PMZ19340.1 sulfotransferase family protein [Pseudomonas sp. FW306-02-F08-AA]PMZ29308.1 sulfotransferase family protein [Pseudomonas sp. FW306-02-F04-BA]
MQRLNLDGWLPIRVWQQGGEWRVDWCWFGDQPLRQPFFRDAVEEALRLPFNQAFRRQTPLSVLSDWQTISPGLVPSAFIFHASRCGSTLISQMLAQLDNHIVISEPPPLDALLRSELPPAERNAAIRGLLSAYGQPRRGVEQRLVIKLDAWNIGELKRLRECFAETPWLFVYRDPLEIAVSHLRRPGLHMVPGLIGTSALDDGAAFEGREDFIARRLGKLLQLGVEHCHEFAGLAVNYRELPGAMEGHLARFFALNAEQRTQVFSAVSQHAKQPAETFVADSEGKQQEASARLRERVECWAHGPYEALEQWRTASCGEGACSRWAAERP